MREYVLEKRPHLIPAVFAALMLFGALGRWPYGYYQLLRFIVCAVGAYTAFMAYRWQQLSAMLLFGSIAILFNPFIPIRLARELWVLIDFICAILFILAAATEGGKKPSSHGGSSQGGASPQQLVDWAAVTLFLLGSMLGALVTCHVGINMLGKESEETVGVAIGLALLLGFLFVGIYIGLMERKERSDSVRTGGPKDSFRDY